ncbi:MAG: hypothetical protein JWM68_3650 [Verrucomicrobiales bacterium]|nr:hypothetical protein [Verrucomicrobiales bacterium]
MGMRWREAFRNLTTECNGAFMRIGKRVVADGARLCSQSQPQQRKAMGLTLAVQKLLLPPWPAAADASHTAALRFLRLSHRLSIAPVG